MHIAGGSGFIGDELVLVGAGLVSGCSVFVGFSVFSFFDMFFVFFLLPGIAVSTIIIVYLSLLAAIRFFVSFSTRSLPVCTPSRSTETSSE